MPAHIKDLNLRLQTQDLINKINKQKIKNKRRFKLKELKKVLETFENLF